MGDLAIDTAVRRGDGRYEAKLSEDWQIWGPAGGYVAAFLLRAAGERSSFPRPASLSCHYLSAAQFGDVTIEATTLRKTKRAESIRVDMTQDGKPIAEALVWTVDHLEGMDHDHATLDAPHPSEVKPILELLTPEQIEMGPPFPFWNNFDLRPVTWVSEWAKREAGEPVWRQWTRFIPTPTFDDPFIDAARHLILLDVCMWPAASMAYAGPELRYIAPSLDLSVTFHRLDPSSEWLLADGYSPIAVDGLVGGTARVWSQDGKLLASARQQMITRALW